MTRQLLLLPGATFLIDQICLTSCNLCTHGGLFQTSKNRFHPNSLVDAIVTNDYRLKFLSELADWIEQYNDGTSNFCLSTQTAGALICTLPVRSQVMLMEDLFVEGSEFILTRGLQSDPIERRSSQYRSMSGGRFLVSLSTSEKILICRSLLKLGDSCWLQEETELTEVDDNVNASVRELKLEESEIVESSLCDSSKDVAHCIAGGTAMKLQNKHKCESC